MAVPTVSFNDLYQNSVFSGMMGSDRDLFMPLFGDPDDASFVAYLESLYENSGGGASSNPDGARYRDLTQYLVRLNENGQISYVYGKLRDGANANSATRADVLPLTEQEKLKHYQKFFEMDDIGNLATYAAQSNGSFARSSGGGEFFCAITPSGERFFVHYSQVYKLNQNARSQIDLTLIVMGVIFQNTNYLIAQMSDLLNAADELNGKILQAMQMYGYFAGLQSNIPQGTEMVTKLTYRDLLLFEKANIELPQSMCMIGLRPESIGFRFDSPGTGGTLYAQYYDTNLKQFVSTEIKSYNWFTDMDLTPSKSVNDRRRIQNDVKNWAKNFSFLNNDVKDMATVNDILKASPLNYQSARSTTFMSQYNLQKKDEEENPFFNENFDYIGTGNAGKWSYTLSARDSFTAINKSADDIIHEKGEFMLDLKGLKSYLDTIRAASDNLNSNMTAILGVVGVVNGDLNQSFSTASGLITKLEEYNKKTAKNIR